MNDRQNKMWSELRVWLKSLHIIFSYMYECLIKRLQLRNYSVESLDQVFFIESFD